MDINNYPNNRLVSSVNSHRELKSSNSHQNHQRHKMTTLSNRASHSNTSSLTKTIIIVSCLIFTASCLIVSQTPIVSKPISDEVHQVVAHQLENRFYYLYTNTAIPETKLTRFQISANNFTPGE